MRDQRQTLSGPQRMCRMWTVEGKERKIAHIKKKINILSWISWALKHTTFASRSNRPHYFDLCVCGPFPEAPITPSQQHWEGALERTGRKWTGGLHSMTPPFSLQQGPQRYVMLVVTTMQYSIPSSQIICSAAWRDKVCHHYSFSFLQSQLHHRHK